ncbi:hypothetical protein ACFW91_06050 [Streptomyces asoensis]|uniref:hypothetical protein n=1 Tax=Streptomyces asoensis TaxID=249586 RepID=UPI00368C0672
MTEDFASILRRGSEELAAHAGARPAAVVRARGDALRRRQRTARSALAVALLAAVCGGAFAVTGPSRHDAPPESVVGPPAPDTSTAPPVMSTAPPDGTAEPSGAASHGPAAGSPSTAAPSCRSLVVPQTVKDAVTLAYRRSQPGLVHLAPVKGTFYYGRCGGVGYAASSFTPTAGAAESELVQLQDEGGAEKYFTEGADGTWTFVATDGFPRDPRGCAAVPEIPAPLAALWGDCLARP